jgi:hypothetical protein
MNGDAIKNVTSALQARLEAVVGADKVHVGPLDDPNADGASLILFLYRIVPSPTLRNHEHRVLSAGPPPATIVHRNSFALDLYFLVTVGRRTEAKAAIQLLSYLGKAILDFHLDPAIVGPVVGHETIHVSFEPLTTDEASRIWQLFPKADYRTSVSYLVTPVWIDPPVPPAGPRVVQDSLRDGSSLATLDG